MPVLPTSVAMDTEDFLHPEGPQLESPKYSAPGPPLPNAIEVPANHIPCLRLHQTSFRFTSDQNHAQVYGSAYNVEQQCETTLNTHCS